jgi:hypothetical protein
LVLRVTVNFVFWPTTNRESPPQIERSGRLTGIVTYVVGLLQGSTVIDKATPGKIAG